MLLGNGNGTFQSAITYATSSALGLVWGDFNGDHAPDLILAGPSTDVTAFLNAGGTAVSTTSSPNPPGSASL